MKSLLFTIIGLFFSGILYGQTKEDIIEYNTINSNIIFLLDEQMEFYNSAKTNSPESIKTFVKASFKSSKPINKLFKKKSKLAKSLRKMNDDKYQKILAYCFEEDRAQEYYHESLDQLIVVDESKFLEWKTDSEHSLFKAIENIKSEFRHVNSFIKN
jgi:hypothetical protein